jgi:hypothetical protein
MSWLTRRLSDGDIGPHVAAETRAMEVAISRRLADTALSLLVTQDDGDKTAALTLLEAAHRVVGLSGAEVHAEDTASWESRVLALEGQLKGAAVSLLHMHKERDAIILQRDAAYADRFETTGILKNLRDARDALQVKLAEALADAAAHFEDVKTARDEADALRQKVATLERDHAALGFTDQWKTWARNLLGVDDGTAQELQVCIAKKLSSHELRFNLNMGLHKETEAWSAWAERTSGRHNPTAPHARQVIERRIGDMAAVCDALKLDREASHEDIIETIKSLQADRAALVDDIKQRDAERAIRSMSKTDRRACPHRPDGDTSACDHCCLFG